MFGGGDGSTTTTLPIPPDLSADWGDVGVAIITTAFALIPISISLWALLDAARRPRWVWALADRRQVVWMALVLFGTFTVIGGMLISGSYLVRIRPQLATIEAGDFGMVPPEGRT